MRGLLFRHLAAMYLRLAATIFGGVLTVFLVADFVDLRRGDAVTDHPLAGDTDDSHRVLIPSR